MAFNGLGTFARLYSWANDAAAGIKIRADRSDAELDGIATGLSTAICKDGQTTTTALIPFAAGISSTSGTFSTTLGVTGALTASALLDISGAAAGQISFPATQNASAGANVLDDYEEGTWTPSVGGTATYTTQTGTYTKIGRVVYFNCILATNAIGTGATDHISGLPFTGTSGDKSCVCSYFSGITPSVVSLEAYVESSTASIYFSYLTAAAQSMTASHPAVITSSTVLHISGQYETT